MRRTYENDKIRVFWDSAKCSHSAICTHGLPSVFNVMKSPWVDVNGADADEIMRVVDACPSGALRYEVPGEEGRKPDSPPRITIALSEDGPYLVTGNCRLVAADGRELASGDRLCLCRCGHSLEMPICDGTHRRTGFKDPARLKKPENSEL